MQLGRSRRNIIGRPEIHRKDRCRATLSATRREALGDRDLHAEGI